MRAALHWCDELQLLSPLPAVKGGTGDSPLMHEECGHKRPKWRNVLGVFHVRASLKIATVTSECRMVVCFHYLRRLLGQSS